MCLHFSQYRGERGHNNIDLIHQAMLYCLNVKSVMNAENISHTYTALIRPDPEYYM